MKILLKTILFFCLPYAGLAQNSKYGIEGKIIDSISLKPVPYATILLIDAKQGTAASVYSAENGSFKIAVPGKGIFRLEISSVGYLTKEQLVSIDDERADIRLDSIFLTAATASLTGITVTASKRLIEQRPGMLVYNAANDVTNKGGTAADVLRKAPVLNVDAQGNVSMRGNSNLKILVNGKYSGQIARSPADALNMMPAEIIQSVEVITTPSAKYDAEGAAGVINIITKKGRKNVTGALELSGSNLEQMFNPRIAITKDKWSLSMHGHLHRYRQKETSSLQRVQLENGIPSGQLNQEIEQDNAAPHGSGEIALVVNPDSLTEISFGSNFWFGNWPNDRVIETMIKSAGGSLVENYDQPVDAAEKYLGTDLTLGYSRKMKKPGQELTLLLQFTPSGSRSPYYTSQMDKINGQVFYREHNNNKTNNYESTIQADYIYPLGAKNIYTLESGLKMIWRNVRNNYTTLFATDPQAPLQTDASRSDIFRYEQNVFAAYSMIKANLENDWYAEAGLRLERTSQAGKFQHTSNAFNNSFTNLIPTAALSKKINEDQVLGVSYTQRLTRPYIWDLSPNTDASDPKNIITGNPALQPEIAKQAEITYGWNKGANFFLNMALFWKQTDNAIVDFTQTDANGVSTTNKQNLASNKTYGLNLSSLVTLSPRWSINGNININYLDFKSEALQVVNEGWAADIDVNTTIKLPQRYSLQVFGEYDGRKVSFQGYESRQYFYSLAAKKELTKTKIFLTLALVNPFSRYIPQTVVMETPDFNSTMVNRYFNRALKLTINWEFGSMLSPKSRKKISNDDVNTQPKG